MGARVSSVSTFLCYLPSLAPRAHRRKKLENSLLARTRELASLRAKPDPLLRQPALEAALGALQAQAAGAAAALVAAARAQLAGVRAKAVAEATMRELEMQVTPVPGLAAEGVRYAYGRVAD
jgi:hypothetical protein